MKEMKDSLAKFFNQGHQESFKRRDLVTAIDSNPEGAYFITQGHIKAATRSKNGDETILYLYGPGDVFPLTWLFDQPIRTVAFYAVDDVKVLVRTKADFMEFVMGTPGALLPIVCQQLVPLERIYNLMRETAQDKIIHSLATMTKRFGEPTANHMMINVHLTQQELASTVRVSRETAGRVLNELERDGVIIQGRRHIRVFPDKLQSLVQN